MVEFIHDQGVRVGEAEMEFRLTTIIRTKARKHGVLAQRIFNAGRVVWSSATAPLNAINPHLERR